MALGPIELLVVKFPGNQFKGEIAPALQELVDTGTIHVIDLLFAIKDEQGTTAVLNLNDLGEETLAVLAPKDTEQSGTLTEDDARAVADGFENNSSFAILLFENTWAARFAEAVRNANGELIFNERAPREVIDDLIAEADTAEEIAVDAGRAVPH